APAVALPCSEPALHALLQVLRVGIEVDLARLLQVAEPFERGLQLHAVVGGRGRVAGDLAAMLARDQDRGPAARTGIPLARPVGEDVDARHSRWSSSRAIVRICISVVPPPSSISFASRARRSTTYSSM